VKAHEVSRNFSENKERSVALLRKAISTLEDEIADAEPVVERAGVVLRWACRPPRPNAHTRRGWHEDDLAGRILEEAKVTGERWRVISLPAVAEEDDLLGRKPGEFLWDDDTYGYGNTLRLAQITQTPRNWSALYQQRPAPETGDYFKEEWLRPYVKAPDLNTLVTYGASDFAPGTALLTSQLALLISTTTTKVESGSNAVSHGRERWRKSTD
jgi:hypothetical protein